MKAIIKYDSPPAGHIYYELPVFEAHPAKHGFSRVGQIVIGDLNDGELPKFYYLSFQPDDYTGRFMVFDGDGKGLTEYEIKLINKSYFYLLDHPDIKECEINLV